MLKFVIEQDNLKILSSFKKQEKLYMIKINMDTKQWCVLCILTSEQVFHTVRWSTSFIFAFKHIFSYLSVTNGKKKEKLVVKGGLPVFRCYSLTLVDTQKLVDSWENMHFLKFLTKIEGKSCFSVKKLFWPAYGMLNTHSLVKIHNRCGFMFVILETS